MGASGIEQFTELYKQLPDQAQDRLYQLALEEAKKAGVNSNGIHPRAFALAESEREALWAQALENLQKRVDSYSESECPDPLPPDGASQIDHYLYGHPKQ